MTEQEQYQIPTEISPTSISTVPQDQQSPEVSPANQEASLTSNELETPNVSTLTINSTFKEDQPTSSPANEETLLASVLPVSSISLSADSEIQSDPQNSPATATVSEGQQESSELQEASITPSKDEQMPLETGTYLTSPGGATSTTDLSFSALSDNHQSVPDVPQWSNTLSNEQPILPESSSAVSQEDQSTSSDVQQKIRTPPQDQSPSAEMQQSSITDENVPEQALSTAEHPTSKSIFNLSIKFFLLIRRG